MSPEEVLIQPDKLSEPEELHLVGIFSDPVVVKYLKLLGRDAVLDLVRLSSLVEEPQALASKHVFVEGTLSVIAAMLSISLTKRS